MATPVESMSREQLYDLVWKEPMLKVAAALGVSSSYMARVCTELTIPRPGRGHWAKLEFGKSPQRPALPPARAGDITHWKPGMVVGSTVRTANRVRAERLGLTSTKSTPSDKRHDLLVGVKPLFLKTRDTETGLLRPFKRHLVDIVSSEGHLDATLDAADALFKALSSRGHHVHLAPSYSQTSSMRRAEVDEREAPRANHYHRSVWSPDRVTVVYIGQVPIGLTLFEMTEEVQVVYVGNSKYVPIRDLTLDQLRRYKEPRYWRTTKDITSGRLALQAYSPSWRVSWVKRWQEGRSGQFASILSKIVAELEEAGPELAAKFEEANRRAEEEQRKWEEERLREQEEAKRAREVKNFHDARQDLLAAIAAWEQARSIHAYFDAAAHEVEQLPESEREQLHARLREAQILVGPVDALAKLRLWKAPHER